MSTYITRAKKATGNSAYGWCWCRHSCLRCGLVKGSQSFDRCFLPQVVAFLMVTVTVVCVCVRVSSVFNKSHSFYTANWWITGVPSRGKMETQRSPVAVPQPIIPEAKCNSLRHASRRLHKKRAVQRHRVLSAVISPATVMFGRKQQHTMVSHQAYRHGELETPNT